jgi:hypothetical protein
MVSERRVEDDVGHGSLGEGVEKMRCVQDHEQEKNCSIGDLQLEDFLSTPTIDEGHGRRDSKEELLE